MLIFQFFFFFSRYFCGGGSLVFGGIFDKDVFSAAVAWADSVWSAARNIPPRKVVDLGISEVALNQTLPSRASDQGFPPRELQRSRFGSGSDSDSSMFLNFPAQSFSKVVW